MDGADPHQQQQQQQTTARHPSTSIPYCNNIIMLFHRVVVTYLMLLASCNVSSAFSLTTPIHKNHFHSLTPLSAKSRKAKRMVDKSRPKSFYDAIDDANDVPKEPKKSTAATTTSVPPTDEQEAERQARAEQARQRMDQRPEISTMIVDEDTGIEIVAQGKSVMDVVTRKPVKLSPMGPAYRMAQMFPGVPPEVRAKYRFDWKTIDAQDMVQQLSAACCVKMADGSRQVPPHPSVANKAIDFVLANRDYLGYKMKRLLGRLQFSSMSKGNKEEALEYQKLWKNYLTLENHISAPFRQMIMDAEGRVGPNFGNLDVKSFCGGELYERTANYVVLKSMVANWEKKVIDADYIEKTPQRKENYITVLSRGDPKRFLPDPPILFTLRECTQVCAMSQQMTKAFVETPELFDDLPPEVRFIEEALKIKGGTPLRKYTIEEFCPNEGITPEALREGLRRLIAQLENMQIDPYGDIVNILERLSAAMAVGSDDERDPYLPYLTSTDAKGPAGFQTYTFDHEKLSRVRFLDSQYEGARVEEPPAAMVGGLGDLFKFGAAPAPAPVVPKKESSSSSTYQVPKARAAGRPHELGWLNLLDDVQEEKVRLGKVKPGKILVEEDE